MESTGKAVIAELVGTFALIFFGAGSVIIALNGQLDLLGVALAHGLVIAIMVTEMGHVSGGVFNPAIQVSLWVTGRASGARTAAYVAAQLVGAVGAAWLLRYLDPKATFDAAFGGTPTLGTGIGAGRGILMEAVGTFFLVWAVFATTIDQRRPIATAPGFAIGLTITIGILALGPSTGGAFNPARWFGPALAAGHWEDWYVWIVGPIAGGVLAGVLYWTLFLREEEPVTPLTGR